MPGPHMVLLGRNNSDSNKTIRRIMITIVVGVKIMVVRMEMILRRIVTVVRTIVVGIKVIIVIMVMIVRIIVIVVRTIVGLRFQLWV